jgi:transposase
VNQIIRIGMDTSKQIFQLHGVDAAERTALRKKLKRKEMLAFFERLAPTVVGIEACGASHHWARTLSAMGHEVKIMAPQFVKPYVKRGKNDAADAEALCEAMSRPSMRFVPMKTRENQAALMLVSLREGCVRRRTQLTNAIRGHAAEFGLTAARGIDKIAPLLARIAADDSLPPLARTLFAEMGAELAALDERLKRLDAELMAYHRSDEVSRRLAQIPGVGPVGAVMLSLKTPDPKSFRSARHFAAWIGLTPKDHSTAGKQRLGVITRAGDEALRAVLTAGAMSIVKLAKRQPGRWPWLERLLARKSPKLAAVAFANKIARIAWKLMTGADSYDATRLRPRAA